MMWRQTKQFVSRKSDDGRATPDAYEEIGISPYPGNPSPVNNGVQRGLLGRTRCLLWCRRYGSTKGSGS